MIKVTNRVFSKDKDYVLAIAAVLKDRWTFDLMIYRSGLLAIRRPKWNNGAHNWNVVFSFENLSNLGAFHMSSAWNGEPLLLWTSGNDIGPAIDKRGFYLKCSNTYPYVLQSLSVSNKPTANLILRLHLS